MIASYRTAGNKNGPDRSGPFCMNPNICKPSTGRLRYFFFLGAAFFFPLAAFFVAFFID
jgi:hypothetical protein